MISTESRADPTFHGGAGNTTRQSFFMSTTVQPFAFASSSALSSLPTWEVLVVGPFALGVGVVHKAHEARALAGRGPLEHLLIAVGVAESEDRPAADESLMPTGLPGPSSMKSIFGSLMSTGLPSLSISNLTTPDEPTTCSGGMP